MTYTILFKPLTLKSDPGLLDMLKAPETDVDKVSILLLKKIEIPEMFLET